MAIKLTLVSLKTMQVLLRQSHVKIKTHGSESRGQGGSSKQHTDGLEIHTREYFTGTRVVKIENAISKES